MTLLRCILLLLGAGSGFETLHDVASEGVDHPSRSNEPSAAVLIVSIDEIWTD